ncbi:MAG: 2,3,4,5-tetrahydropyridine-2,6-dicarboxylate N-succinyltransferase, partial [Terriglobia bacterium]
MQLAEQIERLFEQRFDDAHRPERQPNGHTTTFGPEFFDAFQELKRRLNSGEIRAAEPAEGEAHCGWRVNAWVKKGILLGFRIGQVEGMSVDGTLPFFDKHTFPLKKIAADSGIRVVPGGSSIRDGCYV